MAPTVHPSSGPGPVPLAAVLSDRAGDGTVSQEQAGPLPSGDPALQGIRTLADPGTGEEGETGPVRTAKGESRREEILDSAATLFAEHGYFGASLRDISQRVGVSHPGMLHHFPTKDALLSAVIDRLENQAQGLLGSAPRLGGDRATFVSALHRQWNPRSHPMQLLSTLNGEAVSRDHPARFRLARLRRVHEHVLEDVYAGFAARGELCRGVDPGFAARCTVALVLSLAVREETVRTLQRPGHEDTAAQDLDSLAATFLEDDHPSAPHPKDLP
ncbi:TetR/AcrR family transcriptional regulator [Brachybacterium hainanense]|uniref:TetR/AcrR family transcriptional regulator n=1 Tax=Brachybacterium hainanense TaxID=1541174 RepID=A0ABV6RGS4_9MICO